MKKFICVISSILLSLIAIICGCSNNDSRNYSLYYGANICEAYYFSMNSDAVLTVYEGGNTSSKRENDRIKSLTDGVYDILEEIESAVSATEESSDISRFNASAAGEEIQISQIAYDVLEIAKAVFAQTEGYYNPAVYYGVQAFGFNGTARSPKTEDELPSTEITDKYADLASHFFEVKLEQREGNFYVTKPSYTVEADGQTLTLKIDLGGIGKGYATDRVSEYLDEQGFSSAIFNFGNSSIAAKTYRNKNFTLSLADPRTADGQAYILDVQLNNECVSTSGDYVNYFELNGVRYSHVFDPFTARPVQTGVMTATVIGGSAAENDGYTTAIMAMGAKKATEFANTLSDRRVIFAFISQDGGCYYFTNMLEGTYAPNGDTYKPYGGENVA